MRIWRNLIRKNPDHHDLENFKTYLFVKLKTQIWFISEPRVYWPICRQKAWVNKVRLIKTAMRSWHDPCYAWFWLAVGQSNSVQLIYTFFVLDKFLSFWEIIENRNVIMNPNTRNPAILESQDIVRVLLLVVIIIDQYRFINMRQRLYLTIIAWLILYNLPYRPTVLCFK